MTPVNLILLYGDIRNGYYGLGTHVSNLFYLLKHRHEIRLTIVRLDDSNVREVSIQEDQGVTVLCVPSPEHKFPLSIQDSLLQRRYATRVAEIMSLYLPDKRNPRFLVNGGDYLNVCTAIRETFDDAKIIYVHHAWSWKYFINISDEAFAKLWRNNQPVHPAAFQLNGLQQKMAQIADKLIVVTAQAKAFFVNTLDIQPEKIEIIHNGIQDPGQRPESKGSLRKKYGLSDVEKIVIYTGRVQKEKGVDYLLKAFKLLCQRRTNVRLLIAGDGNLDSMLPLINPFWSRVTFVGLVGRQQLQELYWLSDIGILPSLFEQCSYTAIEMRFHQLPIIVSAVDGLDELFEDGYDALKLPVYEDKDGIRILNEVDVAARIEELLDTPALCAKLTDNSLRKATQQFEDKNMHEKYYQTILSL